MKSNGNELLGSSGELQTKHLIRAFLLGGLFATVCLVGSGSLNRAVSTKNAVVTGLPVVTTSGAKVTVECPLSAALQNPKGQFLAMTSFANVKHEVDTHGCPAIVGKYGAEDKFVYYTPQGCDSTSTEVVLRFYGHYAGENDKITVKSDNTLACERTNGAGTHGNIHGFNCQFSAFEMLRLAPQLPYIRESTGKTALEMVNLVRQDGICPNIILVSTDGTEEYQFTKITNCLGWRNNGHGFWTKGFNDLPDGGMLEVMFWQPNSYAGSPFHMMAFQTYKADLTGDSSKSSSWLYAGAVVSVADMNKYGIPFTKTWTFHESGVKFTW